MGPVEKILSHANLTGMARTCAGHPYSQETLENRIEDTVQRVTLALLSTRRYLGGGGAVNQHYDTRCFYLHPRSNKVTTKFNIESENFTCWSMSACCCWSKTCSCWGVSTCCWRICCICWGVITWGVIIATETGTWNDKMYILKHGKFTGPCNPTANVDRTSCIFHFRPSPQQPKTAT